MRHSRPSSLCARPQFGPDASSHLYTASAAPWHLMHEGVPTFPKMPPFPPLGVTGANRRSLSSGETGSHLALGVFCSGRPRWTHHFRSGSTETSTRPRPYAPAAALGVWHFLEFRKNGASTPPTIPGAPWRRRDRRKSCSGCSARTPPRERGRPPRWPHARSMCRRPASRSQTISYIFMPGDIHGHTGASPTSPPSRRGSLSTLSAASAAC